METKERKLLYVLGALLAVSVLGNLYFLGARSTTEVARAPEPPLYATTSSAAVYSPYGYRSEVVTVYDNGQIKTYATTTPVTSEDVENIRKQLERRLEIMDEYFRRQEELFRNFWLMAF